MESSWRDCAIEIQFVSISESYPVLYRTPYSGELFAIVNTLTSAFALVDEEFDI
jgi:hypothetical protein